MKRRAAALALLLAAAASAQPLARERVGPLADGGSLLPNGWRLRPAGKVVPLDTFPMASALSPDGRYLLVLNAGEAPPTISVLDVAAEREIGRTPVADAWLGLVFAPRGDLVYVGGGASATVFEFGFSGGKLEPRRSFPVVDPGKRTDRDFVGDLTFSPDGRLLYAAELHQNSIAVINPQSGRVIDRFKTGRRPYRILFHPDGRTYFVSCWADGMVLRHETDGGKIAAKYLLAPHPTDMVWVAGRAKPALEGETNPYVARIFVAASNTNGLRVLGVAEDGQVRPSESVNLGMTPLQPAGMTPSALDVDPAHNRLYVACSDENAVAVLDISEAQSRVLGYVPSGRYPTALRALPEGRLVVLNGKGGAASFIDPIGTEELEAYTRTVLDNSPYRDSKLEDAGAEEGGPVPSWPGDPTPLRHTIFVLVDGGLTYDEVFGDIKEGDGDASLVRFGEAATPNLHKLAREFVLLDNFHVIGDGPAEGYNWSVAALAPDYVQKLWPSYQGGRRRRYDFEESEPAAVPPAGYLWTNARTGGVSMASYAAPRQGKEAVEVFLDELPALEEEGRMPRLTYLRLGRGDLAANDRTLGMLVERLSKSRFWPEMAIFVQVSHTGGGRDHVDRHRAPALVISPYAKRRVVDGTMYNTTSMLRTIELISGLQPMTQFDAASRPMSACFQPAPDTAPFLAAGVRGAR
ncbi:MAG: beta-propeller fold lactonase family protein [Bryobacteraceae bacterium]